MDQTTDSIFVTIKKMLGLNDDYTPFDADVLVHINSALMTLNQMGIGPKEGFIVTDYDTTWDEFLQDKKMFGGVKTWVYLQVKMLFDPPGNSFVMDAYKNQADQILWRLNVQAESMEEMPFMREEGLQRGANPKNIPGYAESESSEEVSGGGRA